jgi:hypothetical protein
MGFPSGSVSFRSFVVVGERPALDQALLDRMNALVLIPGEVGVPEESEWGWSGGQHILDNQVTFEKNVYAHCLHAALRIDTNRVPSAEKRAWTLMAEQAAAAENPSGFISKAQKRDVKDQVRRLCDDALRSGRYRKSRLLPFLWDLDRDLLHCAAAGRSFEQLAEIFERTFGLSLVPLSAGSTALRFLEEQGRRRAYEDLRPTRFVNGPEGDSQWPEYPWVAKGPEPKDFLGNEFLLWLWHEAEVRSGTVSTGAGEVTVFFDHQVDVECAYGQTGKDTFAGDGPTRLPEARLALRHGKVPRKASLILEHGGSSFTLSLQGERMAFGGVKLPDVEEAETPRVLFEERIEALRTFCRGLQSLFSEFVQLRSKSEAWEGVRQAIAGWLQKGK